MTEVPKTEENKEQPSVWSYNFLQVSLVDATAWACIYLHGIQKNRENWNLHNVKIIKAVLQFPGKEDVDITKTVNESLAG